MTGDAPEPGRLRRSYAPVHQTAQPHEPLHMREFRRRVKPAMPDFERRRGWLVNHGTDVGRLCMLKFKIDPGQRFKSSGSIAKARAWVIHGHEPIVHSRNRRAGAERRIEAEPADSLRCLDRLSAWLRHWLRRGSPSDSPLACRRSAAASRTRDVPAGTSVGRSDLHGAAASCIGHREK